MLGLDECNQLLVKNQFVDDSPAVSPSNNHDTLPSLTPNFEWAHHPLQSRSVSPARRSPGIPSGIFLGGEGKTRPGLTHLLDLDRSSAVTAEGERITGSTGQELRGCRGAIIHTVGPSDSFAGVALRYGVSIAALRRVNQLWPSDPIQLRTELLIPRSDTHHARHKPTQPPSADVTLRPAVEPPPVLSSDLVASFVAARNLVVSVLPARISLDSSSSKASTSEDHELDDLRTTRAHNMPTVEVPITEDGHELSILATPRARYKFPPSSVVLSSHVSCAHTRVHHMDASHVTLVSDLRSHSRTSSPRGQPFVVRPVRTSQLEPEPAMELPVRRRRA